MTEPKGLRRRRRVDPRTDIPPELAAWFAGEPPPPNYTDIPWCTILWPDELLLRERWNAWAASHPGAKPPAGYEWIAEPPPVYSDDGVPWNEAVEQARRLLQQ